MNPIQIHSLPEDADPLAAFACLNMDPQSGAGAGYFFFPNLVHPVRRTTPLNGRRNPWAWFDQLNGREYVWELLPSLVQLEMSAGQVLAYMLDQEDGWVRNGDHVKLFFDLAKATPAADEFVAEYRDRLYLHVFSCWKAGINLRCVGKDPRQCW